MKSFRERPLSGPYKYLWLDALEMKCREEGRIVSVACLVAVGVNKDGRREILGFDVVTAEDGAGWLAFLREMTLRYSHLTPDVKREAVRLLDGPKHLGDIQETEGAQKETPRRTRGLDGAGKGI